MTPAKSNRRRGMHPMRDFDTLAADLARFDFSTRAGANVFYCHAAKSWTCGEIIFMRGMKPRMTGDDPAAVALAKSTIDDLRDEALCEMAKAAQRGYLGTKLTHGGTMTEGVGQLLEKTIRELQNAKAKPRNQHPRKQHGSDGKAVTPTEAAEALGVSRQTIYALKRNPANAWGLLPAHLTSWAVFSVYLDKNADRIAAHRIGQRNRNKRPAIRLTSKGRIDNAPDCKPHR